MIYIGVDPGATGAIVALNGDRSVYFCFDAWDAELVKRLGERLGLGVASVVALAAIERQQYMAKGGRRQGGKSAFSLGGGYGFWRGYLQAFYIDIIEPRPREWQKYFFGSGTVISDPKKRSVREAQRRLPDLKLVPPGRRVPSHGRADAGLIALWALAHGRKA